MRYAHVHVIAECEGPPPYSAITDILAVELPTNLLHVENWLGRSCKSSIEVRTNTADPLTRLVWSVLARHTQLFSPSIVGTAIPSSLSLHRSCKVSIKTWDHKRSRLSENNTYQ